LLSQKSFKITLITFQVPSGTPTYEKINENYQLYRLPAFEIIPNYPIPKVWKYSFWKILFHILGNDYDLIITRIRFFLTTPLGFLFAKIKRIPHIHIEHTSGFVILGSKWKMLLAKYFDWTLSSIILKRTSINISISRAVQDFMYKFDKRPSPIIYRGLNIKEIDGIENIDNIRAKYGKNKIILVTVARLIRWKGIDMTIEAINGLPNTIKDKIIFLILGDGEERKNLEKISGGNIFFMGALPHKKVIQILKEADIYVHSSRQGGGLSTALLEAMYCECAIVATKNEGADEVIKNSINGILIPIEDFSLSFLKSITKLITSEKRSIIGQHANQTIIKAFDWNASVKKYAEIISEHIK
jgi:glycosyltransferase involved in cell wall biosynthesis